MPMQSPDLDDRTFAELMEQAKLLIRQQCPEWNDLTPGDPGIVLLEAFAFLTETMIFRLNRIPEKAYIEFLKLIGVTLTPPSAAQVEVVFSLDKPQPLAIEIPKSTRITTAGNSSTADTPVFTVAETVTLAAGETRIKTHAYHCDMIEAERIGMGNGLPGQIYTVKHPPIIAQTVDVPSLIVAIETNPDDLDTHVPAVKYKEKTYRIWREVENFSFCEQDHFVYKVDRQSGRLIFSPALRKLDDQTQLQSQPETLAAIPPAQSEIRVWYRHGGGSKGNVKAHTLTVLKDSIAGVSVTNPEAATGGRDSESIQNALVRGPQQLHSLSRAVTARDFELIAIQSSGAVNRAKASTQAQLWSHATAGTVEVTLVPNINVTPEQLQTVTAEQLIAHQLDAIRQQIKLALDQRRPLGTHCVVNWAHYKKISIHARVVIQQEEDESRVTQRILNELYSHICPISLPSSSKVPWPFGLSIKAWDVYKIIGSEPAVLSVEAMKIRLDEVPEKNINAICIDSFQPDTWYCACDERLFRSTNNSDSWELIIGLPNEEITYVKSFPLTSCLNVQHAGLVALISESTDKTASIHVSKDCGQTWSKLQKLQFSIEDFEWLDRDGLAYLLFATEKGIYELALEENAIPLPILVDPKRPKLGFRAISVSASSNGETYVAVAGYENKGVYLSSTAGKTNSFVNIGLQTELIEVLAVQHRGPHRYLWAGVAAPGSNQGKGAYRITLSTSSIKNHDWKLYSDNWVAGGCKSLTFLDAIVLAASYRLGVLRLNTDSRSPGWEALNASACGLPLREVGKLETINSVAACEKTNLILAGCDSGVFRSADSGLHYDKCSEQAFTDEVKIPSTWLFCSGEHQIEIVSHHETSAN